MKFKFILLFLIVASLLLTGCTQSIEKITENDDYVDKSVSVSGTALTPLKLGILSGYTLEDKSGDTILVASDDLPKEGVSVTVKGTLKKGLFGAGYYIDTN